MSLKYEASKEIVPGRERADMRFLGLVRERLPDTSLRFKVLISTMERPQVLEVGEAMFYPDSFSDAREARKLYDSITSVYDFNNVVEASRKVRR